MIGRRLAASLAITLAEMPVDDDRRLAALAEWVLLSLREIRAEHPHVPEAVCLDYLSSVARLAAFHLGAISSLRTPVGHA